MTALTKEPQSQVALAKAFAHSQVGSGRVDDKASFARSLKSGIVEDGARRALADHLNEADENELADLVAEGSATFRSLDQLAKQLLEGDHPNVLYLRECAG